MPTIWHASWIVKFDVLKLGEILLDTVPFPSLSEICIQCMILFRREVSTLRESSERRYSIGSNFNSSLLSQWQYLWFSSQNWECIFTGGFPFAIILISFPWTNWDIPIYWTEHLNIFVEVTAVNSWTIFGLFLGWLNKLLFNSCHFLQLECQYRYVCLLGTLP